MIFGIWFNKSLEDVDLPSGLTWLEFGDYFNQEMDNVGLPSGLEFLTFGLSFNKSLPRKENLPKGLKHVTFDADLARHWLACQEWCPIWEPQP